MTKVVCLCGYTQSAFIFKQRIAAIRKQAGPSTSFTFLDPPHVVQAVNMPEGSLVQYDSNAAPISEEEMPRAWFFAKPLDSQGGAPAPSAGRSYDGLDEAWQLLKTTLESETFDVVLGFSQGAAMAGSLASKLSRPDSPINHPPFKLAILVAGFAMYDPIGAFYPPDGGRSSAKTLQVVGRGDTIVSMERHQTLINKFENPRVEYHEGGHFVPSKASFRKFFKYIFDAIGDDPEGDAWREVPSPSADSTTSTPTASGRATPVKGDSGGKL